MKPDDPVQKLSRLAKAVDSKLEAGDFSEAFTDRVMRDVRRTSRTALSAHPEESRYAFARAFFFPALGATALLMIFAQSCYQLSGIERELTLAEAEQLDPFDLSGAADE